MMSACDGRVDVIAFVVDDPDGDERGAMEDHIGSCERCRARLARLRRVETMTGAAPFGPEPPPGLEDHVFALVDVDATAQAVARAALSPDPPSDLEARTFARVEQEIARARPGVADLSRSGRWQRASTVLAPAFAAAAIVLAVLLLDTRGVIDVPRLGPSPAGHEMQRFVLSGPRGSTEATLEHYAHDNFRIEIDTEGLPLHERGFHYEVWLVGDGGELAVGSFRYLRPFKARDFVVTFNVGLDPKAYPEVFVTREADDGNPTRSGKVVMRGRIDPRRVDRY